MDRAKGKGLIVVLTQPVLVGGKPALQTEALVVYYF